MNAAQGNTAIVEEAPPATPGPATSSPATSEPSRYTRNNPYDSIVATNFVLNTQSTEKETRHIALSLEPGMTYAPGDSIGVLPENRAEAVADVLTALRFTGEERVLDHYNREISFDLALRRWLTLGKLTRSTIGQYAKLEGAAGVGGLGYEALRQMCGPENKARAEEYCWGREFIDLITDFPGAIATPQELFKVLPRLAARLYSIASSQLLHPDTAETTVRVVLYQTYGRARQGVASGQLGERSEVGTALPVFLHSNRNFRLPEDSSAPVIMVGPGTGVAPFRAFLEERQAKGENGKNWLFFGDQHQATDFLYREEWDTMQRNGVLTRLSTAFSRDQAEKIYVQDRIRENAAELYAWLENGAHFYVCGDGVHMAKAVEVALLDAIAKGLNSTPERAAEYLAAMKQQKRYQRDVY